MMGWRWPKVRSFRTRIALVASGTALLGIAILIVGSVLSVMARRAVIFDTMQRSSLGGPMLRNAAPDQWMAFESQLDANFSGFSPAVPGRPRVLLLAHAGDGTLLFRSRAWPAGLTPAMLPAPVPADCNGGSGADCLPLPHDMPPLVSVEAGGNVWRIGAIDAGALGGGRHRIWLAVNLSLPRETLFGVARSFAVATLPMFALLALLSWYLAKRAMRPIDHLTEVIMRLNANDLNQRVSAAEESREFAQLVQVFNDMLDRLQRSFTQAVRFSGNAAHELKTPLTILQGELERCFERASDNPPLEQSLSRMIDEVRHLDSIVKKLLLLSRVDAGQLHLPMLPFDLRPLLDELVEDIGMLAPHKEVRVQLPSSIDVQGDRDLLGQVLQNLVGNALKYGPHDGWVALSVVRAGDEWQIDVANASSGVALEHRDRLFDRFYRADQAHNRRVNGVGLGLSLAREIAHAHKGKLDLLDPVSGQETFRLTLPCAAPAN